MGIADELQKLSELLSQGVLTNEEFIQAKARLLSTPIPFQSNDVKSVLEEQLVEVRHQNELARIDREWEIERSQYQIVGRNGRTFIPTLGAGIATAVVGGLFGVFWTVVAYVVTEVSRISLFPEDSFQAFSWLGMVFVAIGVLLTITAIWRGIYFCMLAQNYRVAYRAYRERHQKEELASQSKPRPAVH